MANESGMKATPERQRGVRVAVVVFTMLALLLLPLRAACHLELPGAAPAAGEHQMWHGDGDLDPCCANLSESARVNSAVPDLSGGAGTVLFVALLLTGLILPTLAGRPRLAAAPPPSRSYHARSARILR